MRQKEILPRSFREVDGRSQRHAEHDVAIGNLNLQRRESQRPVSLGRGHAQEIIERRVDQNRLTAPQLLRMNFYHVVETAHLPT